MASKKVLVLNAGSSSLKFKLFDEARSKLVASVSGLIERIGDTSNSQVTPHAQRFHVYAETTYHNTPSFPVLLVPSLVCPRSVKLVHTVCIFMLHNNANCIYSRTLTGDACCSAVSGQHSVRGQQRQVHTQRGHQRSHSSTGCGHELSPRFILQVSQGTSPCHWSPSSAWQGCGQSHASHSRD